MTAELATLHQPIDIGVVGFFGLYIFIARQISREASVLSLGHLLPCFIRDERQLMSADRRPPPSPLQKNPVALIRSRSPPDPTRTSLELSIPSSTCNEIRQKQVVVVVVLLLEGCDRLDIVRIIITDVGTDVVREGRERERWVATHQKESS
jgi:hypothetical protein